MEEILVAEMPQSSSCCKRIPRIPMKLIPYLDDKFCKPLRVNIGPYNMKSPEPVFDFKEWKFRFASRYIQEKFNIFDDMHAKLFGMVGEFKSYYDMDSLRFQVSDEEFTNMMVEDGCFILGFIQYSSCHPNFCESLFGYDGVGYNEVRSDVFLLENQIPYKVLTELMKFVPDDNWDDKIKHFIDLESFLLQKSNTSSDNNDDDPIPATTSHLLELLQKRLTKVKHWSVGVGDILTSSSTATELSRKSYRFWFWFHKKGSFSFIPNSSGSIACIDFIKTKKASYLLLPPIIVDTCTQRVLANLICQEVYSGGKWITMYVCLLHSLIKHSNDVELLRSPGVLKTDTCTDSEVVYRLNELWKNFIPRAFKRKIATC